MDHASAQDWLDRYLAAWKSYDVDEIGDLFSDDIAYRYHPSDDPVVGREAVVESWLNESESGDAPTHDEPGTYDASYAPFAVDGDVVVATGTSRYRETPDGPVERVYDNCFLMRIDADGRCREFNEFYNQRP